MPPTDQQTTKLHERIDALNDSTIKRLDGVKKEIHDLSNTVTQYTTVTRRHLEQQQQTNDHLQRIVDQHDGRIRHLEQHKAVLDATLPNNEQRIKDVEEQVKLINRTLGKYAAAVGGGVVVVNLVAPPLLRALWQLAFGG